MCRYAYTPLIPAMIDSHWVSKSGAGYLGGFNCLGYLMGCVAALCFPNQVGVRNLIRVSLVLAVLGQAICAWDLNFGWLALGRFVTGFAGASLVIHSPSVVLQHVADRSKKIVSGFMFAGAGGTIVFVCLLVPSFLEISVSAGWLFEAGLSFLAALIAWPITGSASTATEQQKVSMARLEWDTRVALVLLGVAYFLAAVSITPHTLFLTNYLHERFATSTALSSQLFSLVGVGSLIGAFSSGLLARLLGTPLTLVISYSLGTLALLIVLLTSSVPIITISAFMIGFFLMCCVPLTSIRTEEISGPIRHGRDWGVITLGFGLGLAAGSYGMSGLLQIGWTYYQMFTIAQVTIALSLSLSLVLLWKRPERPIA